MIIDIGENSGGSSHFVSVDIKPHETYIEAPCRTTSLRQRTLWGLALKLMSLRCQEKYREEADILIEYSRLYHMTDEEIEEMVEEKMQLSHYYSVEEGYEEYTEVSYRKKNRFV